MTKDWTKQELWMTNNMKKKTKKEKKPQIVKNYYQQETIRNIDKYVNSKHSFLPNKKKQFFNFYKLCIYDPFMKYVDEHPDFLNTKDIKIIKKN